MMHLDTILEKQKERAEEFSSSPARNVAVGGGITREVFEDINYLLNKLMEFDDPIGMGTYGSIGQKIDQYFESLGPE